MILCYTFITTAPSEGTIMGPHDSIILDTKPWEFSGFCGHCCKVSFGFWDTKMDNCSVNLRRSFSDLHWTEQETQFLGLTKWVITSYHLRIPKRKRQDGTRVLKTLKMANVLSWRRAVSSPGFINRIGPNRSSCCPPVPAVLPVRSPKVPCCCPFVAQRSQPTILCSVPWLSIELCRLELFFLLHQVFHMFIRVAEVD